MITRRPEAVDRLEIVLLYVLTVFLALLAGRSLSAVGSAQQAATPSPVLTAFSAIVSLSIILYLYRSGKGKFAELWIGLTYLVFGFVALDMFFPTLIALPAALLLLAASQRCGDNPANLAKTVFFAGAAAAAGFLNSPVSASAVLIIYSVLDYHFSEKLMRDAAEVSERFEIPSFQNSSLSIGAVDVIMPAFFAVSALKYSLGAAVLSGLFPALTLVGVLQSEKRFRVLVPLMTIGSFAGFAAAFLFL